MKLMKAPAHNPHQHDQGFAYLQQQIDQLIAHAMASCKSVT